MGSAALARSLSFPGPSPITMPAVFAQLPARSSRLSPSHSALLRLRVPCSSRCSISVRVQGRRGRRAPRAHLLQLNPQKVPAGRILVVSKEEKARSCPTGQSQLRGPQQGTGQKQSPMAVAGWARWVLGAASQASSLRLRQLCRGQQMSPAPSVCPSQKPCWPGPPLSHQTPVGTRPLCCHCFAPPVPP